MTETEEQRRRQIVTALSHLIPLTMDFHDGCVALTALHDTGLLAKYLNDVARDNSVEFSKYFNFDNDKYVKTDGCTCTRYVINMEVYVCYVLVLCHHVHIREGVSDSCRGIIFTAAGRFTLY